MPILEQIPQPTLSQPGWQDNYSQIRSRANAIPEIALDALAQKLVAGTGIAINYNSATKVLTISGTGSSGGVGGIDTETMMDYLAANLVPGTDLDLTYDDAAGQITLNYVGTGGGVSGPIAPRVLALTDAATITPNADTTDIFTVTLGGNRTIGAPGGTPVSGQKLVGRLKQDGTGSRVPAWNAIYRFPGGTAPTLTTAANKTDYLGFIYNAADSKWDNVAITKNL
jgi:hypothetical protein